MRNQIGTRGLASGIATLAAAFALASTASAGGTAETKTQTPVAPLRQAQAQGHQGHEGHGTPEKAPAAKSDAVKGKVMTIVGEVMDPACYLEAGAKSIGPGHFQCAVDCAKSGQTLAIYDRENDRIYFIAGELPGKNPNAPLLPFIHKKVDVLGTVYHRSEAYGIVIAKVTPHDSTKAKTAGM
ncbi:MAG: hypothetical protein HY568_01640 [Candidatus Latescibacteria bacterium]|nr:hypothetical protein [Candidatus Latescibacterota bacterium]